MRSLKDLAKEKILILDGALGTMVQSYDLCEDDFRGDMFADIKGQLKGNNDVLCLTKPEVIMDIHRRYLIAGADIIETNTFSSQRISQADYGLEDYSYDISLAGAKLARKAADEFTSDDKPRFVAGSVGPTNKTCSMSPDVSNPAARDMTYDSLFEAYKEQISGLLDGGVDALLIETIFDTLNAKVAVDVAQTVMAERGIDLPIMLSVTVSDLAGRTLSGQTLDAFLGSISEYNIFSVGLNCSFGARQMKPYLKELGKKAPYYISAYPNAGLPNAFGQYDESPEHMAEQVKEYLEKGLINIIGGCCGTTPPHIKAIADLAENYEPRKIVANV